MSDLVKLCSVSDVIDDEPRRVVIEDFPPLAIYRVDGAIYVTDDTCTHGMASLAEGYLDGEEIECPFHGGAFNVKTGEPTAFPCAEALKTYSAILQDGDIYIQRPSG